MVHFTAITAVMALLTTVIATPTPAAAAVGTTTLDTVNGRPNVGAANCQQFVTGECTSNEDCNFGCCAGLEVTDPATGQKVTKGICSNIDVGNAAGKLGCNFPANDGKLSGICPNAAGDTPAAQKRPDRGVSTPISAQQPSVNAGLQNDVNAGANDGTQCASGK